MGSALGSVASCLSRYVSEAVDTIAKRVPSKPDEMRTGKIIEVCPNVFVRCSGSMDVSDLERERFSSVLVLQHSKQDCNFDADSDNSGQVTRLAMTEDNVENCGLRLHQLVLKSDPAIDGPVLLVAADLDGAL